MRIDNITGRMFLRLLTEKNELGRAQRNYLLAKAAAERRRREIAEAQAEGLDTASQERMLFLLQRSADAHREVILRLGFSGPME